MKERPILFSGTMVRAILSGSKSQTRRIVKPQPDADQVLSMRKGSTGFQFAFDLSDFCRTTDARRIRWEVPYGQPGDRLWVRETFAIVPRTAYARSDGVQQTLRPEDPYDHDAAIYREGWTRSRGGFRWRPSIHMPRWASRLTLEITGVRVERLQDISEADAIAEGVTAVSSGGVTLFTTTGVNCFQTAKDAYAALWESINGPGSWDANPWVWVVEFRRVEQ